MSAQNKPSGTSLTTTEKERVLHSISERWNGDLRAYLESIAKKREELSAARSEDPVWRVLSRASKCAW